jgi:hypothetical protein
MTHLKPLFHREVPVGGNGNTINVSKYSFNKLRTLKSFKSTHTANYRQVVQYSSNPMEDVGFFSTDGGQHGNLFSGHYFDLNRRHLDGDLYQMYIGKAAVSQLSTETLNLKHESKKPIETEHIKNERSVNKSTSAEAEDEL